MARIARVLASWRRRRAYRALFATPEGQDVLVDFCGFCKVTAEIHVPGDAHSTAYNAGLRRAGLRLLKLAHVSETELARMERDAQQEDFHAA